MRVASICDTRVTQSPLSHSQMSLFSPLGRTTCASESRTWASVCPLAFAACMMSNKTACSCMMSKKTALCLRKQGLCLCLSMWQQPMSYARRTRTLEHTAQRKHGRLKSLLRWLIQEVASWTTRGLRGSPAEQCKLLLSVRTWAWSGDRVAQILNGTRASDWYKNC